jgi:single-strand DNA-binding protein
MVNEAYFSVTGYVATNPKLGYTRDGTRMLSMRVGWTPRRLDRATGDWVDQPSSFISVQCFRKVAEHAGFCLRRGDPILVRGTLRVREYPDQTGAKRISVDVVADTLGHDLSRGISMFARPATSSEQTAEERERAAAGAERSPLPGDRPQAMLPGQAGSDAVPDYVQGASDGMPPSPGGPLAADVVPERDPDDRDYDADDEVFDLEEPGGVQAGSTEPVPALA